jgi:hypothetical protein
VSPPTSPLATPQLHVGKTRGTPISAIPAHLNTPGSYSPAFHRNIRKVSGNAVDSPLDPFQDVDGHAQPQHRPKRLRTSWGGSPSRWKLNPLPPSPPRRRFREEDSFWFSKEDENTEPGPELDDDDHDDVDAESSATSPISEAELTQLIEDARADFKQRKEAQDTANERLEPYRDPPESDFPDFSNMELNHRNDSLRSVEMPSTASQDSRYSHVEATHQPSYQPLHHSSQILPSSSLKLVTEMAPPPTRQGPITPKIQPVQSTGLLLPSPFPHDHLRNHMEVAESQLEKEVARRMERTTFKVSPSRLGFVSDSAFGFGFGFRSAPTPETQEKDKEREIIPDTLTPEHMSVIGMDEQEDVNVKNRTRDPSEGETFTLLRDDQHVPQHGYEASVDPPKAQDLPAEPLQQDHSIELAPGNVMAHMAASALQQHQLEDESHLVTEPVALGSSFGELDTSFNLPSQIDVSFLRDSGPATVDVEKQNESFAVDLVPHVEPYPEKEEMWVIVPSSSPPPVPSSPPILAEEQLPCQEPASVVPQDASNTADTRTTAVESNLSPRAPQDRQPLDVPYFPDVELPKPQSPQPISQLPRTVTESQEISSQTTVMGQSQSQSQPPRHGHGLDNEGMAFSRQSTALSTTSMEPKHKDVIVSEERGTVELQRTSTGRSQADPTTEPGAVSHHDHIQQGNDLLEKTAVDGVVNSRDLIITSTELPDSQLAPTQGTFLSSQEADNLSQNDISKLIAPRRPPVPGLRTRFSYYAPLANLPTYMNKSSQYDKCPDLIVLVYRASTDVEKADKGRKDFYTKIRVTQPQYYPATTLVQVFRPFKKVLPTVSAGEVMLLSNFEVTPLRGGGAGLKSTDQSAWCVFKSIGSKESNSKKPAWARKDDDEGEVMSGPPVEFGDEEREEVVKMRQWWVENNGRG